MRRFGISATLIRPRHSTLLALHLVISCPQLSSLPSLVAKGYVLARASGERDGRRLKFWLDIEPFARYQCSLLASVWSAGIYSAKCIEETADEGRRGKRMGVGG